MGVKIGSAQANMEVVMATAAPASPIASLPDQLRFAAALMQDRKRACDYRLLLLAANEIEALRRKLASGSDRI